MAQSKLVWDTIEITDPCTEYRLFERNTVDSLPDLVGGHTVVVRRILFAGDIYRLGKSNGTFRLYVDNLRRYAVPMELAIYPMEIRQGIHIPARSHAYAQISNGPVGTLTVGLDVDYTRG